MVRERYDCEFQVRGHCGRNSRDGIIKKLYDNMEWERYVFKFHVGAEASLSVMISFHYFVGIMCNEDIVTVNSIYGDIGLE